MRLRQPPPETPRQTPIYFNFPNSGKPLLGSIDMFITKANNAKRSTVFLPDDINHQLRNWLALLHLMHIRPRHVGEPVTKKKLPRTC